MIKKCRCTGITKQGKKGQEYTEHFKSVVKDRRYGLLSIKDASEELNISQSCYLQREKDCLNHLSM